MSEQLLLITYSNQDWMVSKIVLERVLKSEAHAYRTALAYWHDRGGRI